jgi:hypothetical protein
MQVKLGPLVTAAAGSIGGTTFQRNPVATIVRAKPLPILRRTRFTGNARSFTQLYSRSWRTLSNTQRADWQTEADGLVWLNKFGDTIRGLGYWLYIRCNQYLELIGGTPLSSPGAVVALDAIVDPSGDFTVAGTWPMNWTSPATVDARNVWAVFASRGMSAGRSAPFSALRFIGLVPVGTAPTFDLWNMWRARFGALPSAGQVIFATVMPIDDASGYPGVPVSWVAAVT